MFIRVMLCSDDRTSRSSLDLWMVHEGRRVHALARLSSKRDDYPVEFTWLDWYSDSVDLFEDLQGTVSLSGGGYRGEDRRAVIRWTGQWR